jgi:DNA-binding winged helix-turn-helix (wHTH) protein
LAQLDPAQPRRLEVLARNAGRTVEHRRLLEEVWGSSYTGQSNYLRVYIAALRRKLEKNFSRPRHLLTASGLGYRFQVETLKAAGVEGRRGRLRFRARSRRRKGRARARAWVLSASP